MIELYHTNMSVCSQKVRFALAEKKLRWEDHHINLQAGEQLRPEYLKLNPNAVVPTLVDNGTVIIESTVINEYLDDAYLEPSLRPADSIARSRMVTVPSFGFGIRPLGPSTLPRRPTTPDMGASTEARRGWGKAYA